MNTRLMYRTLTLLLLLATLTGTALAAAPTLTTPATTNLGASQVTLNLKSSLTGTGYLTLLAGSGTACGTGAQVKAGQTGGGVTAPYHGSLPLTANTMGYYTLRNLQQSTAYTACFTADDGTTLQTTPVSVNVTSTATRTISNPAWGTAGSAGFSAGAISYNSLAFAPDGTTWVAFRDVGNGNKATVMKFSGTAWTAVGTGVSPGGAEGISLAFSPDGTPYISFSDATNTSKLNVMKYSGSAWVSVGSAGFSTDGAWGETSLAFSPDGTPWVAYMDFTDSATVKKFSGGTWNLVGSAGFASNGSMLFPTLAFSPDGTPWLGFTNANGVLFYSTAQPQVMKFDGANWIDSAEITYYSTMVKSTRLAISPNGTPWLIYSYDGLNSSPLLKYNGSAWELAATVSGSFYQKYIGLAIAPDGYPWVAYSDTGQGPKASVTRYDGASLLTVQSAGFSAGPVDYLSLAFAPDGTPFVAYKDGGTSDKATAMTLVGLAGTTTTVIASQNNAAYGSSLTFTATITPSAATGTVTFKDGATTLGSGSISGGVATYSTSALTIGDHTITAVYGGDTSYTTSTSASLTQSVAKGTTTTALSSSLNPSSSGSQVTFTATLTPGAATGSVTFKDGSTTLGSGAISAGTATYSTSALSVGSHSITAVYSGDSGYQVSTSAALTQTVNKANQTISFAYPGAQIFGISPTLTATASSALTVTFSSATTAVCSITNGGVLTFITTGSCSINADQSGNGSYNAALQVQQSFTVTSQSIVAAYNGIGATIGAAVGVINIGRQFSVSGTGVTLVDLGVYDFGGDGLTDPHTVTLFKITSGAGGANPTVQAVSGGSVTIPSGTAGLLDGGFRFGALPAPLFLTPGNYAVIGYGLDKSRDAYGEGGGTPSGDVTNLSFESWQFVTAASPAFPNSGGVANLSSTSFHYTSKSAALTTLGSSPNPSTYGGTVTLTTTLSPVDATGTVTFKDGATDLGTANISAGSAVFSIATLTGGSHTLTALYNGDNIYGGSTSANLTHTVNPVATTTSVASSLNPSAYGASVTFTATVTPSTATGTITFKDGATTLGSGTLSAGSASFSTSALSVGGHTISAVYGGDSNFANSTSSNLTQTVNQATTTTAVASSLNPSAYGTSVIFTATVTPSTATGSVTFKDGTTTLGSGTLSAGSTTFSTAALGIGSHTVTAVYGGDSSFLISTSSNLTQTVSQATSATSVGSSLNPSVFGTSVTFTATVTPASATGTVTFKDGATTLGSGTISGGSATFSTSTLSVGSHTITALYGGDSSFLTSTSANLTQSVTQASSTTTVGSSLNPSTYGTSVTFTATLTPSTATGTVTFKDGATTLGSGTISSGSATFSTSALSIGSHTITAIYGGDSSYLTSTSANLTQTVNQAGSTTTVGSSLNPSAFGTSVTFTATVTPSTATGTVTFKDGATTLGSGAISGGSATFSTSALSGGSHTITAIYGGNSSFLTSTSANLTQTVNQASSTTTVGSSLNPSLYGASVAFTATVSPSTATGTVTFKDGAATLGSAALSAGSAIFSTNTLTVGGHTITALYGGDVNNLGSTSPALTQTVNKASLTATLASSKNPSGYGQAVTLTATLSSSAASGTVNFMEGVTTLGSGTLASGIATFSTSTLAVGSHSITAVYGGDASFNGVTSAVLTQSISEPTLSTSNLAATLVTLNLRPNVTGTGYFTLLSGSSADCGTGTRVKAGQTAAGGTAPYHGSMVLTANSTSQYTLRNLAQSSAYTICFAMDNGVTVQASPDTANITTAAGKIYTLPGWRPVGTAGFSAGQADYTALAFAPDGTPYIAYKDAANASKATVMKYDGTAWTVVGGVGFTAGTADYTALAFAPDGTAYLAFSDGANSKKTTVMKYNGSTWTTVGSAAFSAGRADYLTLAFAPDGTPFVAYTYYGTGSTYKATVMKFSGSAWGAVGGADISINGTSYGLYPSLAFAPDGTPHLGYADIYGTGQPMVAKFDGASWVQVGSSTPTAAGLASFTNLTFAPDGSLYVAYTDAPDMFSSSTIPTVSKFNGSSWDAVGSFTAAANYLSLAIAPDNRPILAFQERGNGSKATVMKFDGSSWLALGIAAFSAGQADYVSLAVAPDGAPYVVYKDGGNSSKATAMFLKELTASSTALRANFNNAAFGTKLIFTATVSPYSATGTVTFKDGATLLGSVALSAGQAVFSTSALAVGDHNITAVYSGDNNLTISTSGILPRTVVKLTPVITLNSSVTPSYELQDVTFTASVGTPFATGTMIFRDGVTTLVTLPLVNGSAAYNTFNLSIGAHTITAAYSGDVNCFGATSAPLTQTVGPPPSPTVSNLAANQATLNFFPVVTGTGWITLLNGSGTPCGTADQIKAGQNAAGSAVPRHGSLPVTSRVMANYTFQNLTQGSAYTACVTVESGGSLTTPTSVSFTTATPPVMAAGWQNVTATRTDGTESLVFFPDGTPLVAGKGIYYFDVVNGVSNYSYNPGFRNLAFAPDGTLYQLSTEQQWVGKVFIYNASGWIELGASTDSWIYNNRVISRTSLATAPDGAPHAAYLTTSNSLSVKRFNGTSWDLLGEFAGVTSIPFNLLFAPDGTLYVSMGLRSGGFQIQKRTGSGWQVVGSAIGAVGALSGSDTSQGFLSIAPDGTPYAAVNSTGTVGQWTVKKFTGTDWTTVGIPLAGGANARLAMAPDGNPYLVLFDQWKDSVTKLDTIKSTVMKFSGVTWDSVGQQETVIANDLDLVIAPDGRPHLLYKTSRRTDPIAAVRALKSGSVSSTALGVNQTTTTFGKPFTYTATVTPSQASGTVSFRDGPLVLGTATLISGSATLTATSPAAGSRAVTAFYTGDSTYSGSTSSTLTVTVSRANPTLAILNVGSFNNSPQTAQLQSSVPGTISNIRYNGSATAPTALGTYKVTADFTPGDTANYNTMSGTSAGNFVIYPVSSLTAITIQSTPSGRSFTMDGIVYTAPQTFNWLPKSRHTIAVAESLQNGTVGTRYLFASWSDGGATSHTVTTPDTAATYTANFTTEYQLTTAVFPANGSQGKVSPATGGWYAAGAVVDVKAFEFYKCVFTSWTGPVVNDKVTMTAPQSITANFEGSWHMYYIANLGNRISNNAALSIKVINNGSIDSPPMKISNIILTKLEGGTCTPSITTLFPINMGSVLAVPSWEPLSQEYMDFLNNAISGMMAGQWMCERGLKAFLPTQSCGGPITPPDFGPPAYYATEVTIDLSNCPSSANAKATCQFELTDADGKKSIVDANTSLSFR